MDPPSASRPRHREVAWQRFDAGCPTVPFSLGPAVRTAVWPEGLQAYWLRVGRGGGLFPFLVVRVQRIPGIRPGGLSVAVLRGPGSHKITRENHLHDPAPRRGYRSRGWPSCGSRAHSISIAARLWMGGFTCLLHWSGPWTRSCGTGAASSSNLGWQVPAAVQ